MVVKKSNVDIKKVDKKLSSKEIESLIVEFANKGFSPSKIGLALKQDHGIPKVKYALSKVSKVLKKHKLDKAPEELDNLINKASKLRVHFKKNHKDQTAKRGLQITEAKVRKIGAYFSKKGVLDKGWKYTPK